MLTEPVFDPSAPFAERLRWAIDRLRRPPAPRGPATVTTQPAAPAASVSDAALPPTAASAGSAPAPPSPPARLAWSPWPETLPVLGPRRVIPFAPCALCPRWTFASFGTAPLCLDCALAPPTPARLAYREALHLVWTLTAEGERADPAACLAALDELTRWLDEAGEPAATELRRRWASEWHQETGRCPACGECSPSHEPRPGEPGAPMEGGEEP